jgi:regulator of RNase E activity RraA
MKAKIIEYIKRNRVSTTEIADCLYKTGDIPHVLPITRGMHKVGNVFWAYAYGGTNYDLHRQIEEAQEGDILLAEAFECGEKALFGDLVTKYLMLYRQLEAIVVAGYMRDVPRLIKERWPVWCQGFTPIGCVNEEVLGADMELVEAHREKYNGCIAVCDDAGVVVIPKDKHTQEFYERMEFMEEQEDIWYDCIDRRKMSTFETVCLKKYLSE